MAISGFLGQALTDPATGLPNMPYFSLIHDWESRRAARRDYAVKVLKLRFQGLADRSLAWRLCQELRTSDLIASDGRQKYRVLLTSPDAENAGAIGDRIRAMIDKLNSKRATEPITAEVVVEPEPPVDASTGPWGPCGGPRRGDTDEG